MIELVDMKMQPSPEEQPNIVKILQDEISAKNYEIISLRKRVEKAERLLESTKKYNEDLRSQVNTLSETLCQYRNVSSGIHKAVQTSEPEMIGDSNIESSELEGNEWISQAESENISVAECVRKVAAQVLPETNFVYDVSSGYYYDTYSQYYYDPQSTLYYNPRTGTYYYYDYESKTYQFHSQIEMPKYIEVKQKLEGSDKKHSKRKLTIGNALNYKITQNSNNEEGDSRSINKKLRNPSDESSYTLADVESEQASSDIPSSEIIASDVVSSEEAPLVANEEEEEDKNDNQEDGNASVEEGECSSSSGSVAHETQIPEEDPTNDWPPCIRCMVESSNITSIPVGTLFIITCSGSKIGREHKNDIHLADVQISKTHAQFTYDSTKKQYFITDVGSRNGTLLNGVRLSEVKQQSEPKGVSHEDLLEIGSIRLRLHIHPGVETCDRCEPGQVKAALEAEKIKTCVILSKEEKETLRRLELKQIKKKFGLESAQYEDAVSKYDPNYKDRAENRRKTKGSSNPYEKTETASVDRPVPETNMGFKLLKKLGWEAGSSLGKWSKGITEPIQVAMHTGKTGLGAENHWRDAQAGAAFSNWESGKRQAILTPYLEGASLESKDPTAVEEVIQSQ